MSPGVDKSHSFWTLGMIFGVCRGHRLNLQPVDQERDETSWQAWLCCPFGQRYTILAEAFLTLYLQSCLPTKEWKQFIEPCSL